jgi:hypothetical protein
MFRAARFLLRTDLMVKETESFFSTLGSKEKMQFEMISASMEKWG